MITKGSTPKNSHWQGSVNFIKTNNISLTSGKIIPSTHISLDEHNNFLKRSKLKENDLLFSIVGTLGVVGKVNSNILPANTNQQISIIRLKDQVNVNFLLNELKIPRIKRWIKSQTTIGAQPSLSLWQIKEIKIFLPDNSEKIVICRILEIISKIIVLQQRKLDFIKKAKKAIINKIFNDKEKIGWQKFQLGQVFDLVTDYVANGSFKSLRNNVTSYSKPNFAYLIRLQDASNNWKGPWLYTDKKSYYFLKKSKLFPHDIIMSNVGSVGKLFQVPNLNRPMTLAPNAILLRTKSANTTFLFELLSSSYGQKKILQKTTPGVQNKINKTDFKKIIINLPNIKIQNKFGNLFLTFSTLIKNQNYIISKLKKIKKFLLQNMFI